MTTQQILAKHYQPSGVLGGGSAGLERDLRAHAQLNARIYAALFVLLAVILTVVLAMVVQDAREGRSVQIGVLAGAGLTVPAILEMIRRTVREWSQANLMALLSRKLSGPQVQAIIEKLIDKSSPKSDHADTRAHGHRVRGR
jgi:hypothetical protein